MLMMRRPLPPLIALLLVAPGISAAPLPDDIYPLADVRPGLRAVGRTVFEGDTVEEFDVEVLGVMKNALSPKRDVIFVRLLGEKVEYTGVAAGMSGSPVYVDGKLLGALSYRFGSFSKEPLGGVTPIEYMLALDGGPQGPPHPTGVPGGVPLAESVAGYGWSGAFRSFVLGMHDHPFDAAAALRRAAPATTAATITPIGASLALGGFLPAVRDDAAAVFSPLGFVPVSGGTVSVASEGELERPIEPGSSISVQLIRGDMDVTATGTVTHVDGDRLFAFGHQFFNFGRISLPMARASVIRILASPAGSFKVVSVGGPAGSFDQDRMAGIYGHLGHEAAMVPVKVTFADGAGAPISYEYEIAADPILAPLLLQFSLQNVFQAADKEFGEKSLRVHGAIEIAGSPRVLVDNFFSGSSAYAFASGYVAAFLNFLYANEFSLPVVSSVNLQIEASDDVKTAEVTRVVSSSYLVHPGDTVRLRVGLRPHRGKEHLVEQEVIVPDDAPTGPATLYVGEATALTRADPAAWEPRSMDEVIELLNGIRQDNHLYTALSSQLPGVVIRGTEMPGLPALGMAILQADQGAGVQVAAGSSLTEDHVETDYSVHGSRQLLLRIVPRESP